jgi:hypothetical protein
MADALTPRMKALQNLSNQLPIANQKVAQGQQAARNIQLQQAVKAAPTTGNTIQTAQQTGAAAAGQAGQQMIEQAGQQVKQQGQLGQVGLATQQQQAQSNVASLKMGAREQEMDNVARLAQVSEQAKQELYDKQLQFNKDQRGRTMFSERQLMDYALANAKDENDFRNKAQALEQATKRDLQASEQAYALINADLDRKFRLAEQQKDQKAKLEIAEMKRAAAEAMAKKKASSANRAAMFQAGGMVVGAVAGGVLGSMVAPGVGTAAGASAGAQIGSAAGGMAASQTEKT